MLPELQEFEDRPVLQKKYNFTTNMNIPKKLSLNINLFSLDKLWLLHDDLKNRQINPENPGKLGS